MSGLRIKANFEPFVRASLVDAWGQHEKEGAECMDLLSACELDRVVDAIKALKDGALRPVAGG